MIVAAKTLLVCALLVAVPAAHADASASPASGAKAKACKKGFVRKKGRCVCPKAKVRKGKRCVARKPAKKKPATKKPAPAAPTPTAPVAPTPGTPTPPAAADGPPFAPPGHDITGTEAANAILPFLAGSTFTDCPTGFPTCPYEERYGHFGDGSMYYCRLTPTSGSDIINAAHPYQIIGADQKADGSWAATLKIVSYGDALTYYTWTVTSAGVATGLYWGPGASPQTDPATQQIGPLRWVRGARNCSY
jgi:hypothetical protein